MPKTKHREPKNSFPDPERLYARFVRLKLSAAHHTEASYDPAKLQCIPGYRVVQYANTVKIFEDYRETPLDCMFRLMDYKRSLEDLQYIAVEYVEPSADGFEKPYLIAGYRGKREEHA